MMVIMVLVRLMIKSILNYLKYSNVVFQLALNPYWWRLKFEYLHNPDGLDPKMRLVIIRLLMFKIEIVIDDGSW
jgi:hypothetical protein